MKKDKKRYTASNQNLYFQGFEYKGFQWEVEAGVEQISRALRSVYKVMQAEAKDLDKMNEKFKASKEVEEGYQAAQESITQIRLEAARLRCHLTGHKLWPQVFAKETGSPRADRNTYLCGRCLWHFGLDRDDNLVCLY